MSRDASGVLYAQDKGGDENFNVYAVNPAESPAAGQDVPTARNLTDLKGVATQIYDVPRSDPDAIYVGLNDRDKSWHDLYKVKISTGERTLIRKNTERITGWTFDLNGNLKLSTRAAENGDNEILRVDDSGFKQIYMCGIFESCGPVRYHKDGRRVYLETNRGASIDLIRLELFDPETGKTELVEADPMGRVDFGAATFSEVSNELIATAYVDERPRIYWKDKAFEADYKLLQKLLPDRQLAFGSSTKDETLWIIGSGSDTEPGETYLFDRGSKKLTLQYKIREKLPRAGLSPMMAVRFKSSDGLEIPGFLTLPKGVAAKNLPAIIVPHGGLGARPVGYNSFAQFRPIAVTPCCSRTSVAQPATARSSRCRQQAVGTRCRTTSPGREVSVAEGIADPEDRSWVVRMAVMRRSPVLPSHLMFTLPPFDRWTIEPDHTARIDSSILGGRTKDLL